MKVSTWFILGISVILLLRLYNWWKRNHYKDPPAGTHYIYHGPDDEVDEHSPENLDIERALTIAILQNKLKLIEKEKAKTKIKLKKSENSQNIQK
jgi:hypothetical protein